jgi:epoxyqueuosine reductase
LKYTQFIKSEAKRLGFLSCGISKAGFLELEAPRLENWLNKNQNGQMSYMENHFDKRLDTTLLVDGAKSVISLLLNYYPETSQVSDSYKISKYAYGQDYHFVIKEKLKELFMKILEKFRVGLLLILLRFWIKLGQPKAVWDGSEKTAIY